MRDRPRILMGPVATSQPIRDREYRPDADYFHLDEVKEVMDSDFSRTDISVLIQLLFSQPREAFDEIARRHLPEMHRIARAELRRRSVPEADFDADDLVSSSNQIFFSLILEGRIRSGEKRELSRFLSSEGTG